ncbi:MAG: cell division protein FtsL [Eggerthellaceae bacterium]|nr:cell division protein FtsL [Eggerthellaceae bacterium]
MSAVPAYDLYDSTARAYERERFAESDISVVPGRGRQPRTEGVSSSVVTVAKVVAVVLVALALLGAARVALSSAAVAAALEAQQYESQIDEARVEGSKLEVTQSALSNSTHVKEQAAALGMAVPDEVASITLAEDVVKTDAEGNLSLSQSARVAAANGAGAGA